MIKMDNKTLIDIIKIVEMSYDNTGNDFFKEWINFYNDNFHISIRGNIIKKLKAIIEKETLDSNKDNIKVELFLKIRKR